MTSPDSHFASQQSNISYGNLNYKSLSIFPDKESEINIAMSYEKDIAILKTLNNMKLDKIKDLQQQYNYLNNKMLIKVCEKEHGCQYDN
jgi:hypothetical protein